MSICMGTLISKDLHVLKHDQNRGKMQGGGFLHAPCRQWLLGSQGPCSVQGLLGPHGASPAGTQCCMGVTQQETGHAALQWVEDLLQGLTE